MINKKNSFIWNAIDNLYSIEKTKFNTARNLFWLQWRIDYYYRNERYMYVIQLNTLQQQTIFPTGLTRPERGQSTFILFFLHTGIHHFNHEVIFFDDPMWVYNTYTTLKKIWIIKRDFKNASCVSRLCLNQKHFLYF